MNRPRWWIVLSYVLATFVAQVAHDHGAIGHDVPELQEGCGDPGAHWANHADSPDLSHAADFCPACQHRSEQVAHRFTSLSPRAHSASLHIEGLVPADLRRPSLPISSRGPPARV